MPSSTITIGSWAQSVNLQTRSMVQHPYMLRRNLDNAYCILHVTRSDSFQRICLDIKKKKKVFTQGKKRNIYILTPSKKKNKPHISSTPTLTQYFQILQTIEDWKEKYSSVEEGKIVCSSRKAKKKVISKLITSL